MKRQKTPTLVNIAIYTTITIFLWIFFDIYHALKKPPLLDIDNKILEPIRPDLNKNSLEEIDKGIFFDIQWLEAQNQLSTNPENKTATISSNQE